MVDNAVISFHFGNFISGFRIENSNFLKSLILFNHIIGVNNIRACVFGLYPDGDVRLQRLHPSARLGLMANACGRPTTISDYVD